jgi:hypothetical protein
MSPESPFEIEREGCINGPDGILVRQANMVDLGDFIIMAHQKMER